MGAVWVGALTVAVAVGMPIALWWRSRSLKPDRQHAGRPGFGHIDRWLQQNYRLGALERWQVEYAIFGDTRSLKDPQLRQAAHGVASELLSGRLKVPWVLRISGWIAIGAGLAFGTLGIVAHFVTHRLGDLGIFYLAEGAFGMLLGPLGLWWDAKQIRRRLLRFGQDQSGERSSADDLALRDDLGS